MWLEMRAQASRIERPECDCMWKAEEEERSVRRVTPKQRGLQVHGDLCCLTLTDCTVGAGILNSRYRNGK